MAEHKELTELAHHALTHKGAAHGKSKPMREMHVKEMHSGGFHVMRHDGQGGMSEHAAPSIDAVHDHVHEHFGAEAAEAAGEGEKAGGDDGEAESKEE